MQKELQSVHEMKCWLLKMSCGTGRVFCPPRSSEETHAHMLCTLAGQYKEDVFFIHGSFLQTANEWTDATETDIKGKLA